MSKPVKVTVFIPTYNGEQYLEEVIPAVVSQKTDFSFELFIIDSGSSDRTLEILEAADKQYDTVRLHHIPNSEFGHGKTRNLAATMARGEIIVYISQDVTPAHDRWLYEMVKPFEISDNIVGVMGKQIPRPHCIPMLKSEIRGVFAGFGPDFGTTFFYKDDFIQSQGVYDAVTFYSDVNSAARRSYLTGDLPYQDVRYAEDQLFGRDIIDAGLYKVYAPRGSVVHSNDLTLQEYKHRMFDETMGLRKIGLPVAVPSRKVITKMIVRGVIRDSLAICRDHDFSAKRKFYWLAVNPLFHIEKWRGVRLAALADMADDSIANKNSLESRRKV